MRDPPDTFKVSPSQLEAWLTCPRLHFGKWTLKLPTIDRGYGHFGTVLHAVAERWLDGDDRGRRPDGLPVDLYPEGWEWACNRFTGRREHRLQPLERDHVRRVFEDAVESGRLKRWQGRQIEVLMTRKVGKRAQANAYIDVLLPRGVLDHKSLGNPRYRKSERQLREDVQMNFYAGEVLERNPRLKEVHLAHLYYSKNPADRQNLTKLVQTSVTADHVAAWWQIFEDVVDRMAALREQKNRPWFEVQGPTDYAKACNQYGGCDFRSVCTRKESLVRYTRRVQTITQKGTKT